MVSYAYVKRVFILVDAVPLFLLAPSVFLGAQRRLLFGLCRSSWNGHGGRTWWDWNGYEMTPPLEWRKFGTPFRLNGIKRPNSHVGEVSSHLVGTDH